MSTQPSTHVSTRASGVHDEPGLLSLRNIEKRFVRPLDLAAKIANRFGADMREQVVHAIDHADLELARGEVVGLAGESGCGKSTLARIAAGILAPSRGERLWHGQPIADLPHSERVATELKVQMIFQDAFASLNPRMRVEDIISEAPLAHRMIEGSERTAYVDRLLQQVGLDPSAKRRWPHQFSGGQRSRIGIARALAVRPELLICDEAVAALDVSIQAQVLNLFMQLRADLGLTYLFISHDLGVIRHLADRVLIMYLGRIVEAAPAGELFAQPNHQYTQALLAEVPTLTRRKRVYRPIKGEIPSPLAPPSGCHFHPRCPHAMARCASEAPALREIAPGRWSACHLNDQR
jgi:oligopeptide/dipeptide ABC transporter ATP-binding protein